MIVAALSGMRWSNFLLGIREERRGPAAAGHGPDAGPARARSARTGGSLDVALHLGDEVVDGLEALLAPQPLDEPRPRRSGRRGRRRSRAGRPRAATSRLGVERRPAAERDRGRPLDAVGADEGARVDAVGGQAHPLGHRDVRGREAELAARAGRLARPRPRTSCGRPSIAAAPSTSPAASSSRTRVDEYGMPAVAVADRRRDRARPEHLEAELGAHALQQRRRRRGAGGRSGSRRRRRRAARRAPPTSTSRRSPRPAPCCAPRRT